MKAQVSSLGYRGLVASNSSAEILRSLLLVAIGFLLPALVHLVPSSVPLGPILMPLLLPVALAAYVLPLRSALAVSAILPFSPMLETGMPPFPVACEMVAEGALMVIVVSSMRNTRLHWLISFSAGVFASRAVCFAYALWFSNATLGNAGLVALKGIVGLVAVGLILPVLFAIYRRRYNE